MRIRIQPTKINPDPKHYKKVKKKIMLKENVRLLLFHGDQNPFLTQFIATLYGRGGEQELDSDG
jgi:hypothetical protein